MINTKLIKIVAGVITNESLIKAIYILSITKAKKGNNNED